jgi:uncharacterized protein (DUF3820 family)
MEPVKPDTQILIDIVNTRMPFGKHKGVFICDLPAYYLEWMSTQGFPPGKMGMMLSTVFEIKTNGLNTILQKVKSVYQRRS